MGDMKKAGACGVGGCCCLILGIVFIVLSLILPAGVFVIRENILDDVRFVKNEQNWGDKNDGATVTTYMFCVFDITNAYAVQRSAAKMALEETCVYMDEFKFHYDVEFSTDMELYTYSTWSYYVTKAESVEDMQKTVTQANPIWVGGMASYGGESTLLAGLLASGMVGDTLGLFPNTLGAMLQYYTVPTYLNGIVAQLTAYGYTEAQAWSQWGSYGITSGYYSLATALGSSALTDFEFYGVSSAYSYSLTDAQSATLMNASEPYAMTSESGWDIWLNLTMTYMSTGDPTDSAYFMEVYVALGADSTAVTLALAYIGNLLSSIYFTEVVFSGFGQSYVDGSCPGWDYLGASQFGNMTIMETYIGVTGFNSVVYAGLEDALIVAPEYGVWLTEKFVMKSYFATSDGLSPIESYNFIAMLASPSYATEFLTYFMEADTAYALLGSTMATAVYMDWITGTCAYAATTAAYGFTCSGFDYTSAGLSASCSSYDSTGLYTCTNWHSFFAFGMYIASDLLLKYGYIGETLNPACLPPAYGGCETVLNADGTGFMNSGLFMSHTIEDYLFGWTDMALGQPYATWTTNTSSKAEYEALYGLAKTTQYTGNVDKNDVNKYYSRCDVTSDNVTDACTEYFEYQDRPDFGGSCTEDYDLALSGSSDCRAFLTPEVVTGQFSTQIPYSDSGKRIYDKIGGIFVSEIMRQVNFTYSEDVKVEGVDGFKYLIADESLSGYAADGGNPSNEKYGMPDTAIIPMAKLKGGVPAYATTPHFLGADSTYTDMFDGLSPDADSHTTYIVVEPITGKFIDGADKLQLALGVDFDGYIDGPSSTNVYGSIWGSTFAHTTNFLIPMWWLDKSRSITAKQGTDLQLLLYGSLLIAAALFMGFLIPGIICLVIGCGCVGGAGAMAAGGAGGKVQPESA